MTRTNCFKRTFKAVALGLAGAVALSAMALATGGTAQAASSQTVRFGVPSWPGVTVQSQIAADLLEAMGYKTQQVTSSPAFILKSIETDDLDAYLGGWIPTEKDMIDPLVKKKKAVVLTTNISNALMGLAVPAYVADAGVHTVDDLNKFADKFDHKIYGIEAGSGFNQAIQKAIDTNRHDLGKWKLIPSSTAAMLAQVDDAIKNKRWIVFLGWEPHSMNIRWKLTYLKNVGKPTIASQRSDVLTVVNPKLVADEPDAARFLKQFQVPKKVMSAWIYQDKYKKRMPKDIAKTWISGNLDLVAKWLDGVKALDGKPAIDAVKAKYGA